MPLMFHHGVTLTMTQKDAPVDIMRDTMMIKGNAFTHIISQNVDAPDFPKIAAQRTRNLLNESL